MGLLSPRTTSQIAKDIKQGDVSHTPGKCKGGFSGDAAAGRTWASKKPFELQRPGGKQK